MPVAPTAIARPARWDAPFGTDMTAETVERLLGIEPFRSIDASAFPAATPLQGILQNDTRVVEFHDGDLIVREGDYGHSAFLILHGTARVALDSLPPQLLGRSEAPRAKWWSVLKSLWHDRQTPERRAIVNGAPGAAAHTRGSGQQTHVFLQDVPRLLDHTRTAKLGPGELFGELAALTRAPRSATVFAEGRCVVLEIRWQGLRDLMRRTPAIKQHIERLYRDNSLRVHLRETPLLSSLPADDLSAVVQATEFHSFGNFDWYRDARSATESASALIEAEPLIVAEGTRPAGLWLVRSGFVRVSQKWGEGHRTITYLGKGDTFALPELVASTASQPTTLRYSLRALGHADLLLIPCETFATHVRPHLPEPECERLRSMFARETTQTPRDHTPLVDFLVDTRLMNGTEAMAINMQRCTRCDDCVRACAATHDGNPRFVRSGPQFDGWMFAHACMHCVDPTCLIGCPTGAIHREPDSGVVRINDATCIGCATCANSCPYHNIQMVEIRDARGATIVDTTGQLPILKATKCDLCSSQPIGPACVRACPHDALVRLDLANLSDTTAWMAR